MRVAAINTAAHVPAHPQGCCNGSESSLVENQWGLHLFFEGFDDQGRGRRHYLNLGLSVLNGQFHFHSQTRPITGCFGDVITNFLGGQAHGTDLGSQS